MNYVVAVLADRMRAEAAYSKLEAEGLPTETVSIVGQGYKDIEAFSFLDPKKGARRQAWLMSFWLVPFGFVGGYAFNLSTQFELFPWAGTLGNHLIGALFGAIAGAMGSFFVGGGTGLLFGGENASVAYPRQLKQGKYVIVVQGAPNVTNRANRLLKELKPEDIESFIDPQT
ncbi:hypothetical protein [Vacuolonema iberomarrocanum]|uniref:hypothetical protein n=1 Tax=Vacuolonema iberomarrocanum TaxID=3454632 RepID=UPI001A0DBE75|nr:hypothetical protein [filamentous cyanobacterium LEGE 07170]